MANGAEVNNKLSLTKALFDHFREDSANSKKYQKYSFLELSSKLYTIPKSVKEKL